MRKTFLFLLSKNHALGCGSAGKINLKVAIVSRQYSMCHQGSQVNFNIISAGSTIVFRSQGRIWFQTQGLGSLMALVFPGRSQFQYCKYCILRKASDLGKMSSCSLFQDIYIWTSNSKCRVPTAAQLGWNLLFTLYLVGDLMYFISLWFNSILYKGR